MALRPTVAALAARARSRGRSGWRASRPGPLLLAAGAPAPGVVALVVGGGLGVLALTGAARAQPPLDRVRAGRPRDPRPADDERRRAVPAAVDRPPRTRRHRPTRRPTASLDVTGGAPGLALHVEVDVPQSIGVRRRPPGHRQPRGGRPSSSRPPGPARCCAEAAPPAHHGQRALRSSAGPAPGRRRPPRRRRRARPPDRARPAAAGPPLDASPSRPVPAATTAGSARPCALHCSEQLAVDGAVGPAHRADDLPVDEQVVGRADRRPSRRRGRPAARAGAGRHRAGRGPAAGRP